MKKQLFTLMVMMAFFEVYANQMNAIESKNKTLYNRQNTVQTPIVFRDTNVLASRKRAPIQFVPPDTVYFVKSTDSLKNDSNDKMVMVYFGERTPRTYIPDEVSFYIPNPEEIEESKFPGGEDSLRNFLERTLIWPTDTATVKGTFVCVVQFTIESDGRVRQAEVFKTSGNDLMDKEAVRAISFLPNFEPAKYKGKGVKQRAIMPITFEN